MQTSDSPSTQPTKAEWAIAIFASRESASELITTLSHLAQTITKKTIIDILVNGNANLPDAIQSELKHNPIAELGPSLCIRIWYITPAGKANAWNQYIHKICPKAATTFFLDGYTRVANNSLHELSESLQKTPNTLAATGTPANGRSANLVRTTLLAEGGIHGNLFALKEQAIQSIKSANFNLPLGLYAFDTVLGAVISFGLSPEKNQWDAHKYIFVNPNVTWTTPEKKWWHYSDLQIHLRRLINVAQRILEREATKFYLAEQHRSITQLPAGIHEYIDQWATAHPNELKLIRWRSPLTNWALRKLRKPTQPLLNDRCVTLLFCTSSDQ